MNDQRRITTHDRKVQIEGYITTLYNEVRRMDERWVILESVFENPPAMAGIQKRLDGTPGAAAFDTMTKAVYNTIVYDLARLILDDGDKIASLSRICRKAREPKLHIRLKQDFESIPEQWWDGPLIVTDGDDVPEDVQKVIEQEVKQQMRDEDRLRFKQDFEATWESIEKEVNKLESDPVADKLTRVRNRYFAHLEMAPLGQDPMPALNFTQLDLQNTDLLEFEDRYVRLVFQLYRIFTGSGVDVDDFRRVKRIQAESMWKAFTGLEK